MAIRNRIARILGLSGHSEQEWTVYVPAIKTKTNVELAEEILTKNGYCTIHLVKKQCDARNELYAVLRCYGYFADICPECDKDREASNQLEAEKARIARDLEIEFALNVMRERTVCK